MTLFQVLLRFIKIRHLHQNHFHTELVIFKLIYGYTGSSLLHTGFLIMQWLLLVVDHGSKRGLQELWPADSVAPRHETFPNQGSNLGPRTGWRSQPLDY